MMFIVADSILEVVSTVSYFFSLTYKQNVKRDCIIKHTNEAPYIDNISIILIFQLSLSLEHLPMMTYLSTISFNVKSNAKHD